MQFDDMIWLQTQLQKLAMEFDIGPNQMTIYRRPFGPDCPLPYHVLFLLFIQTTFISLYNKTRSALAIAYY